MSNELYRDPTHSGLVNIVVAHFRHHATDLDTEVKLSNGKIADIVFTTENSTIIVEVKTDLIFSHISSAVMKYYDHCNLLILATPRARLPVGFGCGYAGWVARRSLDCGILQAGWDGCRLLRPPIWHLSDPYTALDRASTGGPLSRAH